jgi:hypothetical protein
MVKWKDINKLLGEKSFRATELKEPLKLSVELLLGK